jgi:uncharacterized protein (TIGR00251 family)
MGESADAALKIALAAPPVEGKANAELIAYFAEVLDISRSRIELIAGKQSRTKVLRVRGKSAAELAHCFLTNLPGVP